MSAEDKAKIEKVALDYYQAMFAGDGGWTREVFDKEARFWGFRDGVAVRRGLPEFVEMVETPGLAGEAKAKVEFVDCTGDVAVAKIVDDFRGRTYTDYLSLIREGASWKIVGKLFWAHPEGVR